MSKQSKTKRKSTVSNQDKARRENLEIKELQRKLKIEQLKRDILVQQIINEGTGANEIDPDEYVNSEGIIRKGKNRDRDRLIKQLFKEGFRYKDIAERFNMSTNGIKWVLQREGLI